MAVFPKQKEKWGASDMLFFFSNIYLEKIGKDRKTNNTFIALYFYAAIFPEEYYHTQ